MNLQDLQDRVRWAMFIVLGGLALALFVLDSTGNIDNLFAFLRDPMAAVMTWTSEQTDTVADRFSGPRDLPQALAEINALQARIDALERENEELREFQGEAQILRDLFDRARETPEYRRVTANVIGRDTSPIFRSIIIDKGSHDGVFVGMPVEAARGLVGIIYRTTPQASLVMLVTDSSSRVPARLGNTRATGMLGGGGLGGSMIMEWISLEARVEQSELVTTSGMGGMFPQGLIIGRVVDIERREAELFQRAVVQPAVDFSALEIVFVITNFPTVDTSVFETETGP
jgi:rod shape-determining protein MreC